MQQLIVILVVAFGVHHYWTNRPIDPGPGMIAPYEPVQNDLERKRKFEFRGYEMTALADFRIEARVLSAKRYRSDANAELSPLDLALGWGPMSDSTNLEDIDISQSGRFYHWKTRTPKIEITDIGRHSANMHLIPADETVEAAFDGIRTGHLVRFSGELIKAKHPSGWRWKSSLTRRDAGNGACEVVFVHRIEVIDPTARS